VLSIVVVAIVDDVFVVFLLVAAYGSDGEKHFNFMGAAPPVKKVLVEHTHTYIEYLP
jgi:hypothetical protein